MPTYRISIRKNDTGQVVEHVEHFAHIVDELFGDDCDDYFAAARWERGNWSCDCNRELEFQRATGKHADIDSVECSEGRYSVQVINEFGKIIYDELGILT